MTGSDKVDVAIIGGGTAGCAAALELRRRGLSVALFERRTVGSQASGVNYGGVRQQGRDPAELPLSRRSRPIWDRLPALVGHDCEFMATGHLKLAYTPEQMAELEAWSAMAAEQGVETRLMGANALAEAYPGLITNAYGGSLCPTDGQANPRLVAPAFARAARRAGAAIHEHEAVTGATRDAAGFRIETERGTRILAQSLINVAGAWADHVARWFGEFAPIQVLAPNMLVSEPVPYRLPVNIGVCGAGLYVRQIPRGNLIFGGGKGWADREAIRARPLVEVSCQASAQLARTLPWAANAAVIRSWTGIEGYFDDDIPVIGLSETTPGLVHAFGFSGHGFQLGPAIGEIVSELVVEGKTTTPIDAFSIRRFARAGHQAA
ncbi:MAG: FAD-binding oxidoreductase [Rhodospirillaceae bacterium]|nr:FAD-binding oxidoreductase [Rhodospirillaceae bacterium]